MFKYFYRNEKKGSIQTYHCLFDSCRICHFFLSIVKCELSFDHKSRTFSCTGTQDARNEEINVCGVFSVIGYIETKTNKKMFLRSLPNVNFIGGKWDKTDLTSMI